MAAERDPARQADATVRLVQRAQGGDREAFVALVRAHDERLRGLAYQLLRDPDLMDDVLQEAYLRAFRALPRFEARAGFGTWLHRIAYNACMDELRRRRRRPWLRFAESGLEEEPAPDEPLDDRAARSSAVRAALAALRPEERAAVWLVDAEGRDYREVAELTGVAEGTVASRLNRARTGLRRALTEERTG